MLIKKFILSAACVALGSAAYAAPKETKVTQPTPVVKSQPQHVVTVEGISEYRLANGLKVVLYPDQSKPTATVNMTYLVGSRHENYGETGMAHLLEHLMFKGSKNFPNPTAEFTKRGFRMNGSTWLDRTNYHVSFTATDDNMQWALAWQADAMVNSFIARKDLDSEMTVVRNEYEMGENRPSSVLMKRLQSMIFDWHAYGRSTIGARSDIENVEIANLRAFYEKYYQPDNAVLTISGKFDPAQVLAWVQKDFAGIPKPTRALPHEWTVEPTADGEREFTVRRPGETKMIMIGYRVPSALSPDYEPVNTATSILGNEPTGRLYKALVEKGLATQVFGWTIPGKAPGFVIFGAMLKKDADVEPVKAAMIKTIEGTFADTPTTEQELAREKSDQATMFERQLADPEQFGIELSEYIALGDWRLFFVDREESAALTAKAVDEAAKKYFVRDNRVVGVYIPTTDLKRAEIPAAPSAEEILKGYTFKTEGKSAEAFDTTQENINARTERLAMGDMQLALLPKKSLGETVQVRFKFLNGTPKTAGNAALNMVTSQMFVRGAKGMTNEQIEDKFTALKMEGTPFDFTTDREHVVEALAFVGHLLSTPTFPEKEFETLRSKMITGLSAKSDDPQVKARDWLNDHFNTYPQGDVRHTETSAELIAELNAMKRDDVVNYWRDVFQNGLGYVAVVGDFDVESLKTALETKVIGTKTSKVKYERAIAEYKPVAAERVVIDTPEKDNAVIFARTDFEANEDDKDAAALYVADWIVGGSTGLSNRLVNRIRQKEGLSYGVGSNLTLGTFGNRSHWGVGMIVAPQNAQQAEASLKDELRKAFDKGITDAELAEAKQGILDYRAINRAQDSMLAASWVRLMEKDRDWTNSKELDDAIKALTVEDVNQAIKRMMDPTKLSIVLAGDLTKAKAAGKDFTKPLTK